MEIIESLKQENTKRIKSLSSLYEKLSQLEKEVKATREEGDLSENAGYSSAVSDKAELQHRIKTEEKAINNFNSFIETVEEVKGIPIVKVGSMLKIKDGDIMTILITPPEMALTEVGAISSESPIGKALIGAKRGDTVNINCILSRNVTILEIL